MPADNFDNKEIDKLIKSIFEKPDNDGKGINSLFESRLSELDITFNQVCDNLAIEYRTLNGILEGNLKQLNFLSLLKLAQFLNISYNEITDLYISEIIQKNAGELAEAKKRTFILNYFDLPTLKNLGIINSIKDFDHIEERLIKILNLKSILDYNIASVGAAYSSGKAVPKNLKTRDYFIKKSETIFKLIDNPNPYNKDALVEYFPKIRWHSIDEENGLLTVFRALYKLGVTVIFQPKMPALQLRGATFALNNKPCIVLTDFKGYYPTLWFALIHELFHVLFDWNEISTKKYHLSDEEDDLHVLKQKEDEANEFAREYMFPRRKLELINDRINERFFIKQFALDNHVHPSIVYAYYAFDHTNAEFNYWALFQKHMPSLKGLQRQLTNNLGHSASAIEFADYYKSIIINNEE